jgi:hypothetical protein
MGCGGREKRSHDVRGRPRQIAPRRDCTRTPVPSLVLTALDDVHLKLGDDEIVAMAYVPITPTQTLLVGASTSDHGCEGSGQRHVSANPVMVS